MKKLAVASAPLLVLLALLPLWGAPMSRREEGQLVQKITRLANAGHWDQVGDPLRELSKANTRQVFRFIVAVVEKAPPTYDLDIVLADAAGTMTNHGVQEEVKRAARHSRSKYVRRALIGQLARMKDYKDLIRALKDRDEEVASEAAWQLVDHKVPEAVTPMIDQLEKCEKDRSGIWDVLNIGLGKLLGQRCDMAVEYRSLWKVVQSRGGLSTVKPSKDDGDGGGGGLMHSAVRLFGRAIDCTRVVFILDVSGSMTTIDPDQQPVAEPMNTRTHSAGNTQGPDGHPQLTRLERAQRELENVIRHLPANYRINIVTYSTTTRLWHANRGDLPPELYPLNARNRKDALDFVAKATAQGVTVTDDALLRAYEVDGARCFYLLSDGFATHDGTTQVPTADILKAIAPFKQRHVIINTLGFVGADKSMMQAVADATGGKYSDIK